MIPEFDTALLWPAIAQAVLIALVYGLLGLVRRRAIRTGKVPDSDFPPGDEPADSAAVRRLLANQFELPVLFFAVVAFLTIVGGVSPFATIVAWMYVAARALHSYAALRGPLLLRHTAFTIAFLLVAILWFLLILTLVGR